MLENKVHSRTAELAAANDRLQELDKLKTNFFANVSHELRTPLTLLLGPLDSLLAGDYGDKISREDKLFLSMHRNGVRLLKLINDLLDFSKIEAGRMQVNRRRTDIKQLVSFYLSAIESAAESRNQTLTFTHNEAPLIALVDRDLLEKAFFNLISNAMKFTPEGGAISVDLQGGDGEFSLAVKDTGMGIPEDKLEHIFERFSQLDGSATRQYEGTGIGLAFTKEIIDLHGGTIAVSSAPGEGSVFTLTLPCGAVEENTDGVDEEAIGGEVKPWLLADIQQDGRDGVGLEQATGVAATPLHRVGAAPLVSPYSAQPLSGRILVVDDNADMRRFVASILEGSHSVFLARDGAEGLEQARRLQPDLILSDVMMPNVSGYELCRQLKTDAELRHIPVILLTAKADIAHKIEGLEHGADDYLTKPFNARELTVRVRNLLLGSSLQRELQRKQQELEQDLAAASLVQQSILTPAEALACLEGVEAAVRYLPMNGLVSGDYYHAACLKGGLAGVLIADATGHGAQAAMSTMQIDILNKESLDVKYPDERLEYINNRFTREHASKNFFTAFAAHIYSDRICYSSAGHPHQYLIRSSGEIVALKTAGSVIGFFPDIEYRNQEQALAAGDILFLFSDGVTEEMNQAQELFGEERLVQLLQQVFGENPGIELQAALDRIGEALHSFRGSEGRNDDVTMLALRIR